MRPKREVYPFFRVTQAIFSGNLIFSPPRPRFPILSSRMRRTSLVPDSFRLLNSYPSYRSFAAAATLSFFHLSTCPDSFLARVLFVHAMTRALLPLEWPGLRLLSDWRNAPSPSRTPPPVPPSNRPRSTVPLFTTLPFPALGRSPEPGRIGAFPVSRFSTFLPLRPAQFHICHAGSPHPIPFWCRLLHNVKFFVQILLLPFSTPC